jgi:hypothetical protein
MEIALIGWGSLIWCPGCLRIKSRWYSDGPPLPIEFARISGDKRLTLVIHLGPPESPTPKQQTYWALSECKTLDEARENLRKREGAKKIERIYGLNIDGKMKGEKDLVTAEISRVIHDWLMTKHGVEAAVWTGLPTNWPRKRFKEFSPEDALQYLDEVERAKDDAAAAYGRAREYITNTPPQIQTRLREMVRKRKGWKDTALAKALFEVQKDDMES